MVEPMAGRRAGRYVEEIDVRRLCPAYGRRARYSDPLQPPWAEHQICVKEAFHSMASPPHGPAALPITYKQSPHKPITSGKTRARTHWKHLRSGRSRKLALSGHRSWPSSSICPRLLIPQARAGPSPFAAGCRVLHLGDSVLRPLLAHLSLARLGHLVPNPPSLLFRHASRSAYRPRGKALGWKELDAQQLDRRLF